MNILAEIKQIRKEKEITVDTENVNPYRLLLKESDGLTAYYFSLPIYRERDRKLMDFCWKARENAMVFQGVNADIIVQNNIITIANTLGKSEISFEDDIEIQPTFNGVAIAASTNRMKFGLRVEHARSVRENGDYFALMQDEFVPFIVVSGIMGRKGKACYPLKITNRRMSEVQFEIKVVCEYEVDSILFEVNAQLPKLMFDTTVESKNPDKNNAFGGIAFLGNSEFYGEQWLYSRFDTMQLIDLNGFLVKEANLYMPKFSDDNNFLESYKMTAPWCSFGSTWNTKTAFSELLHKSRQNKKYAIMEVSGVIRDILRLNEPRNPGIVIKDNKNMYSQAF